MKPLISKHVTKEEKGRFLSAAKAPEYKKYLNNLACAVDDLANECHKNSAAHGFWDEERNVGEMLALIHSELSEALEAHRRDGGTREDHHVQHRTNFEVELADAIIRILDLAHAHGFAIGHAVVEKHLFNMSRDTNKHGKKY